jgi:hypothetical protein
MRGFSFGLMVIGVSIAVVAAGQSDAKVAVTRSERCMRLSRQVDEAIETHAKAMQVTEAKGLQKKANRYCADKKQAQGIRMLANALKLLGVTPTDPGQ